jgi:hypothetical protein
VAAVLTKSGEKVTTLGRIVPRRDEGVIYNGEIGL